MHRIREAAYIVLQGVSNIACNAAELLLTDHLLLESRISSWVKTTEQRNLELSYFAAEFCTGS